MSAALMYREKRQFGRRSTNIRGRAIVSGRISKSLTVRNISDGGALLQFDEDFIPQQTFRIEVEGGRRHATLRGQAQKRRRRWDLLCAPARRRGVQSPLPAAPRVGRASRCGVPTAGASSRSEFVFALAKSIAPRS